MMPLLCRLGFHNWGDWSKRGGEFFRHECIRCDLIAWHIFPPKGANVWWEEMEKFAPFE